MKSNWEISLDGRRWSEAKIIKELFKSRRINDPEEFMNPSEDSMLPFEELKNIDSAYKTIMGTIKNGGKFLIYGDPDFDGCASAAIVYRYLKNYTENVSVYLNNGKLHGVVNFDYSNLDDVETLIIVDSINDYASDYRKLIAYGVNVVVLDHHVPTEEIKKISKAINLVSSAYNYGNPYLSGAGVCLKMCLYIDEKTGNNYADDLYDFAGCSIISDVCSVGPESMENRYICKRGFENVKNIAISKINGNYEMNSTAVGFGIAPLINGAIRSGNGQEAMSVFLTDDADEVKSFIFNLKQYKKEQSERIFAIFESLKFISDSQIGNKTTLLFVENEENIAGLLATKFMELYKKPALVLRHDNGTIRGSFRAVGVDNFIEIINSTGLAEAMGHEKAGGIVVAEKDFPDFVEALEEKLSGYTFVENEKIDILLTESQITSSLIKKIKSINKISGNGFPAITVAIEDITDYSVGSLSGGKHLKIDSSNLSYIKWNHSPEDPIRDDMAMYAFGTLDESFFGRKYTKQLIMNDFGFEEKIEF